MKDPIVSVITCFYNEEAFLEETIQSVLHQTYPHWELILVDDGSHDASSAIAKRYSLEQPDRIRYVEHEGHANKGLCKSRNVGVANSRGDFMAYLDADDVWLPDKLRNQLRIFEKNPEATVLLEASEYWCSWQDASKKDTVVDIGATPDIVYRPPALQLQLYPLGQGAAPCPSGIMVRRSVHDHISFVEAFTGPNAAYEDQAFLAQVYLSQPVFVSSQCNNRYRQRPASMVFSIHQNGIYHRVRQFYLEWFERYLNDHAIHEERVSKLLRQALLPYHYPLYYAMLYTWPAKITRKAKQIAWKLLNRIR